MPAHDTGGVLDMLVKHLSHLKGYEPNIDIDNVPSSDWWRRASIHNKDGIGHPVTDYFDEDGLRSSSTTSNV